jgi:hypothetical protein
MHKNIKKNLLWAIMAITIMQLCNYAIINYGDNYAIMGTNYGDTNYGDTLLIQLCQLWDTLLIQLCQSIMGTPYLSFFLHITGILRGHHTCVAGQGRVIQRVGSLLRKVGQPPGSKSLEAFW